MEKRLKKIREMEEKLIVMEDVCNNMNTLLHEFEHNLEVYKQLIDYYESFQWLKDYDSYRNGEFPQDIKVSVLGEDPVYNVIFEMREIAIKQLELATAILKGN